MKFEGASRFPTRNFPYHRNASGLSRDGLADPLKDTPTGAAARFILGIDRKASVLDPRAEASPVNDAFAKLVLAPGHGRRPCLNCWLSLMLLSAQMRSQISGSIGSQTAGKLPGILPLQI